jgi:hypothetical protein
VGKPFVFVSCGQFTDAEKQLGNQIAELVRKTTDLDAFFAQDVQDLNGLDTNILNALRDCAGLITVMHPRGEIQLPGGSKHSRASVWIEQEIAIATYIQCVEKRHLPVIAFVHNSVGLEGIRGLLHLNPLAFTNESEILESLPDRLKNWRGLSTAGLRVELESVSSAPKDGHSIWELYVYLANDTNQIIANFTGRLCVPAGILSHWTKVYPGEEWSEDSRYRCFRFDADRCGYTQPRTRRSQMFFEYCTKCGSEAGVFPQDKVQVTVWFENREYSDQKTIEDLARERVEKGR